MDRSVHMKSSCGMRNELPCSSPNITRVCPCGRRTWLEIIVFTLETQLLLRNVVSATITSSPHVRILILLIGHKRIGNTDGATLSICCLNASVSVAWTARWH